MANATALAPVLHQDGSSSSSVGQTKVCIAFVPCCSDVNSVENEPYVCMCRRLFPQLPVAFTNADVAEALKFAQQILSTINRMLEYWTRYFALARQFACPANRAGYYELLTQLIDRMKPITEKLKEFRRVKSVVEYTSMLERVRGDENLHTILVELNGWQNDILPSKRITLYNGIQYISYAVNSWIAENKDLAPAIALENARKQLASLMNVSDLMRTYRERCEPGSEHRYEQRSAHRAKVVERLGRFWKTGPLPEAVLNQLLPGWSKFTDAAIPMPNMEWIKNRSYNEAVDVRSMVAVLIGLMTSSNAEENVFENCLFLLIPIAYFPESKNDDL